MKMSHHLSAALVALSFMLPATAADTCHDSLLRHSHDSLLRHSHDSLLRQHRVPAPVLPLRVERLPQLNVARSGHHTFCTGNGVIVMGGHTTGFVPTATAESYYDGQWHLQTMVYSHDQGVGIQMETGAVIIAGGHEQPLGIGQTFTLERYGTPDDTFDGYGCLEQKRCFAQALEMDSQQAVICGNWYAKDCIELFDGSRQCRFVKDVAQQRSLPYILRTAKDNAVIFGSRDLHADPFDSIITDRLNGEPFCEPLLQQWRPLHPQIGYRCQNAFIGDEQQEHYAYIIPAYNTQGQMALIKVEGEHFSLLPTTCPVPMKSHWGDIGYFTGVIANRKTQQAYILGYGISDDDHRLYVLRIDYGYEPAALTLLQSEPQDSIGCYSPVLTPDGNLLMAGGIAIHGNNFTPQSTALLLYTGTQHPLDGNNHQRAATWLWIPAILLAATTAVVTFLLLRKRRKELTVTDQRQESEDETTTDNIEQEAKDDRQLIQRVCQLMEQKQLYLNSELKITDVAKLLNTNSAYISSCINTQKGCSFSAFVNTYRIEHAKQLLRQQPEAKIYEVCVASGFSTETSFFRVFKALTGKTPTEWRQESTEGSMK